MLILLDNLISDFSPLAGLTSLHTLRIERNWGRDISSLDSLNLTDFRYDQVCELPPVEAPVVSRIEGRNFPSVFQAWDSMVGNPKEGETFKLDFRNDPLYNERVAQHDLHFSPYFTLQWDIIPSEPTSGLSTRLGGDLELARAVHQKRRVLNPNMLFLFSINIYQMGEGDFPEDSDFWLRNDDGEIAVIEFPHWNEYQIDFSKTYVQDHLIKRIVGIAECGLFDGIMLDGFVHNGTGFVGRHLHTHVTDEEIIETTERILREVT